MNAFLSNYAATARRGMAQIHPPEAASGPQHPGKQRPGLGSGAGPQPGQGSKRKMLWAEGMENNPHRGLPEMLSAPLWAALGQRGATCSTCNPHCDTAEHRMGTGGVGGTASPATSSPRPAGPCISSPATAGGEHALGLPRNASIGRENKDKRNVQVAAGAAPHMGRSGSVPGPRAEPGASGRSPRDETAP